jgi:alpha-1,3-mannosyl-glycoprotein beta-1,2-N-acetylglucosaminyltransferase
MFTRKANNRARNLHHRRGGGGRKRPSYERLFLFVILMLACVWIMGMVGMVFYHGYYKKPMQQPVQPQKVERRAPLGLGGKTATLPLPFESPLLIVTCSRSSYLQETLEDIRKYIPRDCRMGCPIIVSQDGNNRDVVNVISHYKDVFQQMNIPLVHIQHTSALRGGNNAYQALAIHYGWALNQVFEYNNGQAQRVIILEEDLHVASDFFDYFYHLSPILESDSTLFAVSAFNDNGFRDKVKDSTRVLRTDFFPGLGWMLTRKLWDVEWKIKWPNGYWDDWVRDPAQRQSRHVLRPEVSRTYHFGSHGGASGNEFGDQLSRVLLNPTPINWEQQDLTYLQHDAYNRKYLQLIQDAQPASSVVHAMSLGHSTQNVRLEYKDLDDFFRQARMLELMDDEKAGISRTSYKGVVETRPSGDAILFLTPSMEQLVKEFRIYL